MKIATKVNEIDEITKAQKIILDSVKVKTKKTEKVKEDKFRNIYGIRQGVKPSLELKIAVKLFELNKDKNNITFNELFTQFKTLIIKNGNKVNKNTKNRLGRILTRSIESGIARESIQGIKFNLYANYKGIKIVTSSPLVYDTNFNVSVEQMESITYSFKFNKDVILIKNAELNQTTKEKVKAFKDALKS
jgi:hypothetical protein